jgi:tetratricopeptide (TPR) repeat protein
MSKVRFALFVALLALCATAAFGQIYVVQFVSGPVDLKAGSSWKPLEFDARLGSDAVLRLGAGGLVELAGQGGRVSAAKAGTYKVADLFVAGAASRGGVMKGAVGKLTKLATTAQPMTTAVGGVRGDLASGPGAMMWSSEDDPDELLARADEAAAEGRLDDAASDYEKAFGVGGGPRAFRGQVFALAAAGRSAAALAVLIKAESTDDELLLLRARLLIDASAPEEAEILLGPISKSPELPKKQEALLLLGYSAWYRSDAVLAAARFEEARELDPASEIGGEAAARLAELK